MTVKSKGIVILVVFAAIVAGLIVYTVVGRSGAGDGDRLEAGFDSEFLTRPDGYPGLQEAYGLSFADTPMHLDPGMMYKAVETGEVDVICGFLTDGRIEAYDLKVLDDDRSFFPPYDAAPLVRAETLERYPQLREILGMLAGRISTQEMRRINYDHDRAEGSKKPYDVAYEWLLEQGLIAEGERGDGSAGVVVIGGKNFTEQDIIGEMMAILIEHHSDLEVDRKLGLGGTMICFNALRNGDLDLYAEYTGTGLVSILDHETVKESDEALRIVRDAFAEQWDLVWLDPFGFNNTYTLTMRGEQADALGLETISDLAEHVRSHGGAGGR